MKLSITLTTCNRQDLVPQAIESLLAQQVDFDYEVVVGEDFSSDRTLDVVLDYERRHPGVFRVFSHPRNLGLTRNFAAIYAECRGDYVATLDDDDFWLSSQKLQKQIDFLDEHGDCALCFHDSRHFLADRSRSDYFIELPRPASRFELADLFPGPFIPTSSVVVRRAAVPSLPEWFTELRGHDWALHLLAAQWGWLGYIPEVWSATRIHDRGVWNGLTAIEQRRYFINDLEVLKRSCPPMRNRWTRSNLAREHLDLAAELLRQGEIGEARSSAIRSFLCRPFSADRPLAARLRVLADALLGTR